MGVVYEAEDTFLGRVVALKTIEPSFGLSAGVMEEFEQRFFTEARVAARLSHPGIVVCHDVGKDPETHKLFIVFERLLGQTLAERLSAGPVPWREALDIVARVARAIHHAHEHGVVHRDLKPANIMLLPSGGEIKIMDFGVAKLESNRVRLTATGQSFGSPLYMSPEQALGHWSDSRTDIFSLGSILCTLLVGRPWFEAPNIPKILARVVHDDPPVLSSVRPGLPDELDRIVAHALAKRVDARYQTASALADDLEDVLAARSPRHTQGWIVGPMSLSESEDALLAELTAPSGVDPGAVRTGTVNVLASLVDEPPAPPRPIAGRARRFLLFAAAALIAAAVAGAIVRPGRATAPATEIPVVREAVREATSAPATSAPTTARAVPAMTAPPIEPKRTDPPAPPTVEPVGEAAVTSAPEADPRAATRLRLDVSHPLENGRLIVWVDGVVVVETKLQGDVAKKVVGFKIREGHAEKMLDVTPGRHEVKVEMTWDDKRRAGTTLVDVVPETTGLLEVRMARVTKDLSLEWSSLAP